MKLAEHTRNPAILQQLRTAARRRGGETPPPAGATDYDWTRPHHFTPTQRANLEAFAEQVAKGTSDALAGLLRVEIAFEAAEVAECYACAAGAEEAKAYHVPLHDPAGEPCGLVRLPAQVAVAWVASLLGGSGSADGEAGELASLETALLLDLVAAMAQALSATSEQAGGPAIRHGEAITSIEQALASRGGDELCRFTFRPTDDEAKDEFAFFLRSALLEPVADPTHRNLAPPSDEETRAHLAKHIKAAPVTVTAQLGAAAISVRDLVSLEPGDVVVLGSQVGETITLAVGRQVVLRGIPAVSGGRYAVQVQDRRRPRLELQI